MVANKKFLMGEGDTPTHVYKPRQRTEGTGKKAHLPVSLWKGVTFILSQLLLESLASNSLYLGADSDPLLWGSDKPWHSISYKKPPQPRRWLVHSQGLGLEFYQLYQLCL